VHAAAGVAFACIHYPPGGCSGLTVLTCPSGPFASAASTIAWLGSPASLAGFRFDATHTIWPTSTEGSG
jgi:hypothetical protein